MAKRVSSSEAKAQLSALAAEVAYVGQHVIIERHCTPFVALVSASELEQLLQHRTTSTRPQGALALVGAWRERQDEHLDSLVEGIYADRDKHTGRPVELEV